MVDQGIQSDAKSYGNTSYGIRKLGTIVASLSNKDEILKIVNKRYYVLRGAIKNEKPKIIIFL